MAIGPLLARVPLLPTTVVGSYPVPDWMERLKTDYFRGRMSRAQLGDLHEMAIKAALRDQELAGIDIVSDGELRRDNDIDYFLARELVDERVAQRPRRRFLPANRGLGERRQQQLARRVVERRIR